MAQRLILGSASARRRKILREIGVLFEVLVPQVAEMFLLREPGRMARENARLKAEWCAARRPDRVVISADTIIDLDGRAVGKPDSLEDAAAYLRMFSGRKHKVYTAVALALPGEGTRVELVESGVVFKRLDDTVIRNYFSLVDPLDKAGGYDIDQHGDLIVESYSGSRTNIMGLPFETVVPLLESALMSSRCL